MKVIILSAILSAGNSSIYAASRTLLGLADSGYAPKSFAKLNSRGVPVFSLMLSVIVGTISCLGSIIGLNTLFDIIINTLGYVFSSSYIDFVSCFLTFIYI